MPVAREGIYGVIAEFETPSDLCGRRRLPMRRLAADGLLYALSGGRGAEAIGFHKNRVSLITLVGG